MRQSVAELEKETVKVFSEAEDDTVRESMLDTDLKTFIYTACFCLVLLLDNKKVHNFLFYFIFYFTIYHSEVTLDF